MPDEKRVCPACGKPMREDEDAGYWFWTCDDCEIEFPSEEGHYNEMIVPFKDGQRHPTKETIQSIRKEVLEEVDKRLRLHLEAEYSDNETEEWAFKNGIKWAMRETHNLREGGD